MASPVFTGTPVAPTPATNDNSTTVATTAYVKNSIIAANAGLSSIGAISATSNSKGATISGTTELILTPADASNGGVVTTGTQTFAGSKTFTNTVTFGKDITVNGMTFGRPANPFASNTQNIAIGNNVMGKYAPTAWTTDYNIGIGYSALFNLTNGGENVAIGSTAMYLLSSGDYNTGIGSSVMSVLTTGNNNTVLGAEAGRGISTGSENTFIGSYTGVGMSGSNNILIGSNKANNYSLGTGITTGNSNTIIGSGIRSLPTTLSNNVILADGDGNIRAQHNGSTGWTIGTIVSGTWSGTTIGSNVGGAGTVNGLMKANGSGVVSAAVAGTDYQSPLTAGSGISINAGTISATGLTSTNLASNAAITNGQLANSTSTIGSTTMTLGGTITSVTGLSSVSSTNFTGALTGDVTGNVTGNLTGNASTATKLAATKNINGIAFDGSADITIAANSNTLTGTTLASNVVSSSLTSVGTITSGVWSGTEIAIAKGGTGATTATAALTNLGAEPAINKSFASDLGNTNPSDVLFPTQKAVKTYVDAQTAAAGVADGSITNAKLAGSIAASKLVGTDITTVGTITSGVWSGTAIANANLANSALTIGSTNIALGATSNTLAGLSTVTSNNFVGALTGNASTATKLAATKNINGVAFDGSADITVAANSNTLTGTTLASNVVSSSLTSVGTITSGVWSGTAIANANLANSALTIGSTNIALGATASSLAGLSTVTSTNFVGALTGNASTATKISTGRTISTTGDITYTSGSFDGSGDVTGVATLAASGVSSGTYGSSTAIPVLTVDTKGRVTSASTVGIIAGVNSLNYTSTTSYAAGGTISGTSLTLTPADESNPGLISTGTQTIVGAKTFSNTATFNSDITVYGLNIGRGSGSIVSNTSVGNSALPANTTGNRNTASGYQALQANTTGSANTAFGYQALQANTTGFSNVAVGNGALYQSNSYHNIGIGESALAFNYSGAYNIGIGRGTMTGNKYGSSNIAIGSEAGYNLNNYNYNSGTGGGNVFIGFQAARGVNLGSNNTALGTQALNNNLPAGNSYTYSNNVAIGSGAGQSSLSDNNTFLGANSNVDNTNVNYTNFTNSTAVGYNAIVTASNSIQLGNTNVTAVNTSGTINAAGFSGPLTGNATTATTAGNITATSNTTLTSLANLATVGTITAGTWSATEIAITKGGTGATTASGARTNLGLGSIATKSTIADADVDASAAIAFSKLNITKANITGLGVQEGLTAGSGISISAGTISATGLTTSNLASNAAITNAQLANSTTTLGSTTMTLGGTVTSVTGLTSVSSTGFTGALTGNASTATKLAATKNINGIAFDGSADITIAANSNTLTGTTLASNVVSSSLTGVGTITSGTWNGSVLTPAYGGTGLTSLGTGIASFLATPTSANLNTAVTDETGSGSLVFATSPALVTPNLGIPSAVTLTNATGLPVSTGIAGLGTGIATFLATPTSSNLAATLSDETGTGGLVFATSPILVTPNIGTASGTSLSLSGAITSGTWSASTIGVGYGGTGLTSPGASGNVLTSNGTSWVSSTPTGVNTLTYTSGTSYANGGTISGTTLTLGAADASNPGLLTPGTQIIGGSKTFSASVTPSGAIARGVNFTPTLTATASSDVLAGIDINPTFVNGSYSSVNNYGLRVQGVGIGTGKGNVSSNTTVGNAALGYNTTGNHNASFGYWSSMFNTTGIQNTAVGSLALKNNETGSNNVAIGFQTMQQNINGNYNTAIGSLSQGAIVGNYTNTANTSVGYNSLNAVASGSNNIAIGYSAMYTLTSGKYNIAIGDLSGSTIVSPSGTKTTGDYGLYLGYRTSPLANNTTNEIIIGSSPTSNGYNIGLGDNSTVIGNSATQQTKIYGILNVVPNVAATAIDGLSSTFAAQNAGAGSTNSGGSINITAGNATSSGNGGNINLTPGTSPSGTTGIVQVNGQVKITGGSPGAGKVLTSDANGLATWKNNGGTVTTASASTTYSTTDNYTYIIFSGSTASQTITLPTAAQAGNGREYTIKNIASVNVTVSAGGTCYIISDSGTTTATSAALGIEPSNNWMKLISDGTSWYVIRALF